VKKKKSESENKNPVHHDQYSCNSTGKAPTQISIEKKEKMFTVWIYPIFIIIVNIATSLGTWYLFQNATESSKTAQQAITSSQDQFNIEYRPYIQLINIDQKDTLSYVGVQYTLINYGKSPAKFISVQEDYKFDKHLTNDEAIKFYKDSIQNIPSISKINNSIGENASNTPMLFAYTQRPIIYSLAINGQIDIYFYGRVVYMSPITQQIFELKYLYRLNGQKPTSIECIINDTKELK
jgi:hypothetical protein